MSKLILFKNLDKEGHERWYQGRDMMNLPHPFRALIVGKPNRGKTLLIKNLIYYSKPRFKHIFLLHAESGFHTQESSNSILSMAVPMDYKGFGVQLLTKIPDIKFWNNYEKDKVLLIVDDFNLKANKKRLDILERTFGYVSTHKGVSCVMALQNGFDKLSLPFRRHCNLFVFFKTEDEKYNKALAETAGISREKINKIFNRFKFGIHDSLWVDFTAGTPYPLRVMLKGVMRPVRDVEPSGDDEKSKLYTNFDRVQTGFKESRKYNPKYYKAGRRLDLFKPTVKATEKAIVNIAEKAVKKANPEKLAEKVKKFAVDLFKPSVKSSS